MAFLDWMQRREKQAEQNTDPGKQPSQSDRRLITEQTQDREMARERDDTGKEPEARPLQVPSRWHWRKRMQQQRTPVKRAKVKDHDIPF